MLQFYIYQIDNLKSIDKNAKCFQGCRTVGGHMYR